MAKKTLIPIKEKFTVIKDTEAPKVGSRALRVTNITDTSITILWERATDNVTAVDKIRYQVGLTESDNPQDPWHIVKDAQGICSHTFTGLKPKKQYSFYVKAYDAAGNICQYPVDNGCMRAMTADSKTTAKDTEAPKASNRDIRATNVTSNSITIVWEAATDNQTKSSDILYSVYIGKAASTVEWKMVKSAKGITSYTATNLEPGSKYAFVVYARDNAGNKISYPVRNCTYITTSGSAPGNTAPAGEAQRRQLIRTFFSNQKGKDTIEDIMVSTVNQPIKDYIVSGKQAMLLQNEQHDICNQRDEFMPINEAAIYPGRLVYADRSLVDGKPSDINFYVPDQTGKVTVNVNFLAAHVGLSEKNVKATYDGIQEAIGKILNRALATGALPPSLVESNTTISNSKEKISIDAGCSVDYLGAKCKIDTTTTKNQESFYQLENFKQGFYQVSIEAEDRDSVNYLGTGVTVAALEKAREYAPLAIIKSVTYGRIGYNIKKYDASAFTFKGDEKASYKTYVEATSKQDIEKNSRSSSHFARIWGGSATTAGNALTKGRTSKNNEVESKEIDAAFTDEMAKTMEVSMRNQGVPISYTVVYLASGREVGAYLTGKYLESKYVPLVNRLSFDIEQKASVLKGTNTVYCKLSYTYIKLDSNGNKIGVGTGSWDYKWSNNSGISRVIELPENCYFKNNELLLTFESRRAASAGLNKWKKCSEGYINVTGGKLKIRIEGSYYHYSLRLGGSADNGYAQFK